MHKKFLIGGLLATSLLYACAGPSIYRPLPQSNFAYPNSNVIPLSHAQGTSSRSYVVPFQAPDFDSGSQLTEAENNALQTSGGELLIDGSYSMNSTLFPLPIFQVWTVDVNVDGTAAKMEIGRRNLR